MADVLSQSQIDALLSSLQNEEAGVEETAPKEPELTYKKYDFYSPKKYTKEKLKMLRSIYDNYARIATSQVNGLFRVASEVEVVGVEEERYYEFGNALNESDVITLARITLQDDSKNPPMLFHIAPALMGAMIDRMLGGNGSAYTEVSYTYTEIELALYARIIRYFINITKDVWASYIKFSSEFERVEENPSMFQGINVDETVVIVMINITLGDIQGVMNICIPDTLLFNIFDIIEKTKHLADKDNSIQRRTNREEILGSIKDSQMTVKAELGKARVNLDDIYNLHVGDVINLNKPQDSDVALQVAGQHWFNGQLGVYNKNIAVKISERTELRNVADANKE